MSFKTFAHYVRVFLVKTEFSVMKAFLFVRSKWVLAKFEMVITSLTVFIKTQIIQIKNALDEINAYLELHEMQRMRHIYLKLLMKRRK